MNDSKLPYGLCCDHCYWRSYIIALGKRPDLAWKKPGSYGRNMNELEQEFYCRHIFDIDVYCKFIDDHWSTEDSEEARRWRTRVGYKKRTIWDKFCHKLYLFYKRLGYYKDEESR